MHLKILDLTAQLFSHKTLYQNAGKSVVLPFYHAVGYARELYYLSDLYHIYDEDTFIKDIESLLKEYKPIDLFQLLQYYEEGFPNSSDKYIFFSFDDGLSSCYDIISPFFLKKGIPATFFLNTGFIGNRKMFHRLKSALIAEKIKNDDVFNELRKKIKQLYHKDFETKQTLKEYLFSLRYNKNEVLDNLAAFVGIHYGDFLQSKKPYMDEPQIKSLLKHGFTIGGHSIDHPEYYLLSQEEQLKQTIGSVDYITKTFGVDYRVFSFPFTDIGVKKSFFSQINHDHDITLTFGCSGIKNDEIRSNLHRIPMDMKDKRASKLVKSELFNFIIKRKFGKHIFNRE